MKIKHVITTLALAGLMGAGAFAGIKASGIAKEANAVATTYYLDMTDFTNWENANATFYLYVWDGGSTRNYYKASLHSDHIYKVDADLSSLTAGGYQFFRVDPNATPSGSYNPWNKGPYNTYNNRSQDYCKITNWNESGTWETAEPPAPEPHTSFSLCGTMNNWNVNNTDYDFTIAQDNSSATLTTRLETNTEFKIITDRKWAGEINFDNLTLASSIQGGLTRASQTSSNIKVSRAGTFTFTLDIDTSTYAISEASAAAVYAYKATIGGVDHPLTPNAAGDVYSASGLNITAGQTISIKLDNAAIDAGPEVTASNNVYQDSTVYKVLANNASADLYYHVSANDYWVSGLASNGYHILKDGETFIQLTEGSTTESGHVQWYSDSIDFALNDSFRVIDCNVASSLPVLFDITTIEEYGEYANFTVSGGVVTCTKACTVQIYLKIKNGDNRIYFGSEPEDVALARQFAQSFIDDIVDGACNGGYPVQATLESAWAAKATAYGVAPMTDDARDELKTNYSVQVIKDFRAAYAYILNLRGAGTASNWNLNDFMGLNTSGSTSLTPAANQPAKYAMPVVIVIVSSISLVSVLGIGLMIKRRKEDR